MSLLSKEDRAWRRYQRKESRQDRRQTRSTEGTIFAQRIRRKRNEK